MNPLARHERPGPRYTSYPTVPEWKTEPDEGELFAAFGRLEGPVSVYVHVPFCAERCTFCGCTTVVAHRRESGSRYLDAVAAQVASWPLPKNAETVRIHLGGGTPTWLDVPQLERLFALIDDRFARAAGAEVSVEVDPEVTSDVQLEALARLGVTRLSLGVQSFDPRVLAAVRRPQRSERVAALLAGARRLGMRGLNVDLMIGLPHQDAASLSDTLDRTLAMDPDRLAVFAYAHVPRLRPHQRDLDEHAFPSPDLCRDLHEFARRRLVDAGYASIGFDHYAKPGDDLAEAAERGVLHRNFMGYTTLRGVPVIGLGMSAISELPNHFAQVVTRLPAYHRAARGEGPWFEKSRTLTPDDRLRRDVIADVMCNMGSDVAGVAARHAADVAPLVDEARRILMPMEDDGLVEWDRGVLRIAEKARPLLRQVAMAFDAYLPAPGPQRAACG